MMNLIIIEKEDSTQLHFNVLESWDDFEVIVNLLIDKYNFKIISKLDGPESRIWVATKKDIRVSIHNNPYGNYIKAIGVNNVSMLHYIYNTWDY